MEMRIAEACRTLGVQETSSYDEVKKAYRNLMRQFHPDSAGDGAHAHMQAQKINEAYRLIKKTLQSGGVIKTFSPGRYRSWKDIDPGIPVNPMAYCERNIFLEDEMLGDHLAQTGLVGRYYWDPEVETFELFLRSVNMAVTGIMDHIEMDEASMFRLRSGLLHLLLQEFIDPMQLMDEYDPIRKTGGEYVIHCGFKPETKLSAERRVYEVRTAASKLYAAADEKIVGTVSFVENALYYIVTPLLIQGAATAQLEITETKGRSIKGNLHVTLTGKPYNDATVKINEEIRKRLKV